MSNKEEVYYLYDASHLDNELQVACSVLVQIWSGRSNSI